MLARLDKTCFSQMRVVGQPAPYARLKFMSNMMFQVVEVTVRGLWGLEQLRET